MEYVTRAEWGAVPPRWSTPLYRSLGVFIHYNGGNPLPAAVTSGDYNAVCAHLRSTQQFHMGPSRGWPDIAYSWCVDGSGRIYELRGWGVVGAHTFNWNDRSHAIYLPLGGDQAPTEAQIAGARTVIAEHDRRYGVGFVKGHQQAPNSTSCPGEPTMARILAGDFQPRPEPPAPEPEEDEVKSAMIQDPRNGRIFHCVGNTRYRLEDSAEVDLLKFLGVPLITEGGDALVTWLRTMKDLGRPRIRKG